MVARQYVGPTFRSGAPETVDENPCHFGVPALSSFLMVFPAFITNFTR